MDAQFPLHFCPYVPDHYHPTFPLWGAKMTMFNHQVFPGILEPVFPYEISGSPWGEVNEVGAVNAQKAASPFPRPQFAST